MRQGKKVNEKLTSLDNQIKKMSQQLDQIVENQKSALNSSFAESLTETLSHWSVTAKNLSLELAGVVHRHGGEYWEVGKKKGIQVGSHLYEHGTTLSLGWKSLLADKLKEFGVPPQYTELVAIITLATFATLSLLLLSILRSCVKSVCCGSSKKAQKTQTHQKPTNKKEEKTKEKKKVKEKKKKKQEADESEDEEQ